MSPLSSTMLKASAILGLFLGICNGAPKPPTVPGHPKFTYFEMPSKLSGPCDLCTGSDGAIWVQDILEPKIQRIDRQTGNVTEYVIPYTDDPKPLQDLPLVGARAPLACAIRPGADGNIYAASGTRNQFMRINPITKEIKVFKSQGALGNLLNFNDIWKGPLGTGMFFSQTTGNKITLFDYKKETFKDFDVPTPLAGPLGMKIGSTDGLLWFAEFFANKMASLNYTDGSFKEYPLPLSLAQPTVVRAQKGKYIYFTALTGNGIGRIDTTNGALKSYTYNHPGVGPAEDTIDRDGNVWFSTFDQDTLPYLDPSTGKFTTVVIPNNIVTNPIGLPVKLPISVHYGPDNAIWFAQVTTGQVGRYQLPPPHKKRGTDEAEE